MDKTKSVKIERLLFPSPVLGGANLMLITYLTFKIKTSDWRPEPIKVKKVVGDTLGVHYRIVDGRHRTMASICAGLEKIDAVILED